jgi:hypothetical protein
MVLGSEHWFITQHKGASNGEYEEAERVTTNLGSYAIRIGQKQLDGISDSEGTD